MTTYVYRLFSDSELLYVGITNNLSTRFANHQGTKAWWPEVQRMEIKLCTDRDQASEEERSAIRNEHPRYNQIQGQEGSKLPYENERSVPKTMARLPEDEIEYLKTLSSEETYLRCAELQEAGWSVPAMLAGAKVAPTATQLRAELKYIKPRPSARPVPQPPLTRLAARKARKAAKSAITADETLRLQEYARVSSTLRAHNAPGDAVWEAVEEYKAFLVELHDRGVSVATMASAAGVNTTVIHRRIREGRGNS